MSYETHLFDQHIRIEAGAAHRGGKIRFHAFVNGVALKNKRGALRTFPSREKATEAAAYVAMKTRWR